MRELDDVERKLLEVGGAGFAPTSVDRARVDGKLQALLEAGASSSASGGSSTLSTGVSASGVVKIGIVVAAMMGVGASVMIFTSRTDETRPAGSRATQAVTATSASAATRGSTSTSASTLVSSHAGVGSRDPRSCANCEPSLAVRSPDEQATSSPLVASPAVSAATHRPSPRPVEAALSGPTGLLAEQALLSNALHALDSDQAPAALGFLAEHRARFPHGQLAEEREGLTVLALAEARRTAQATRAAEAFLRAHPASPLAARIRAALERSR